MNPKLFLIFLVASALLGTALFWYVEEDFVALQDKMKQPDYQAYTKEVESDQTTH